MAGCRRSVGTRARSGLQTVYISGHHGKGEISVKMLRKEVNHSTLLPWRESASWATSGVERRRVTLRHVGAEKQAEVIEEDLGKCFWRC